MVNGVPDTLVETLGMKLEDFFRQPAEEQQCQREAEPGRDHCSPTRMAGAGFGPPWTHHLLRLAEALSLLEFDGETGVPARLVPQARGMPWRARPASLGSATHCQARRPFSFTMVRASPYSTSRFNTVVTEARGSL